MRMSKLLRGSLAEVLFAVTLCCVLLFTLVPTCDAAAYMSASALKTKLKLKKARISASAPAPAKPKLPQFPKPGEEVDNSRFVLYHKNSTTCYIHGVDTTSVNLNARGPFVSLGPPIEEMNGVQVFGSPSFSEHMPALLLHIPAAANPLGNFERWAIFASIARPKARIGKAAHEQILETTAVSNGTEWRVVVDHGSKQKYQGRRGLGKPEYPHAKVVVPVGAPYCVTGHDVLVDVMGSCRYKKQFLQLCIIWCVIVLLCLLCGSPRGCWKMMARINNVGTSSQGC